MPGAWIHDSDACLANLLKRERKTSTGIGKGVALPHGICPDLRKMAMVIGVSNDGIEYGSVDGLKCHIFVLILAPTDDGNRQLKLISRLSKMLGGGDFRRSVLAATTADDVIEVFEKWEADDEDIL